MSKRKLFGVADMFASGKPTQTKAGWCLRRGLEHICKVDGGVLAPLVEKHGLPNFYTCVSTSSAACRHEATDEMKDPSTCFESLCRIVVGQFVSGKAARVAWGKLLSVVDQELVPSRILDLAAGENSIEALQKPAGTTRSKALSLVDLAQRFEDGRLSEEILTSGDQREVREALLAVKGIGPWSADMFQLFYLESSNVLPLGDLAVRKGLLKTFDLKGSAKKGDICPKKDKERVTARLQEFEPYHSLVSYYMYRVLDTPNVSRETPQATTSNQVQGVKSSMVKAERKRISTPAVATPSKKLRRSRRNIVTP